MVWSDLGKFMQQL